MKEEGKNDIIYIHSLEIMEGRPIETTNTIEKNSKIGTLIEPKREGYAFDGWYTSPTGGEKITSQTLITENVTYYAHWIYNQ